MRKGIVFIVLLFVFHAGFTVSALQTSAKAAAVINGDTGEMIFEKNAMERLPMASTTKIMTALLLCEQNEWDKTVTVTPEMLKVEGSSMGLLAGDTVSYHDLLYGLLLASGNDAANVTAYVLDGSLTKFAERMNRKATDLGLRDTAFVTPSGLDADGHYTTAADLAFLAKAALRNEAFAKAAASASASLYYVNPPYKRTLHNHNKLLETSEGVIGVKTGFTKKAGRCLVSAAKRDGKYVIAVTLNDPNDWADHRQMLDYGFDAIVTTDYIPQTARYCVPVIGGKEESVEAVIEPYRVNTVHTDQIRSVIRLPKFVYAPLKQDETIGEITYYLGEELLASKPIRSEKEIAVLPESRNLFDKLKENLALLLAGFKES